MLSSVTVNAIPDAYQDVTNVTAGENEVLEGYTIVDAEGNEVGGSIPINTAEAVTLDVTTREYTIPEGYHDGTGTVAVSYDDSFDGTTSTVIPSTLSQLIEGYNGAFLTAVAIDPIPSQYQDVTPVTASANEVL